MTKEKAERSKFPPLYWLVVVFEFFERGSYYGVMSVLSVYLTDQLHFPKEDVGVIKSVIQPLLYFLPIITGALADRFGYRRTLLVAFGLLGSGYMLTSQATGYAPVFLALVVMGLGAGTFKPVISGTIARCTDETNSTLGFGIFYWSINLGAFVVPLFLVPYLKNNVGWDWVIIAAAIGTGAMLIPTALFFKEPPAPDQSEEEAAKEKTSLLQTLANAFEILYSPFVLLHGYMGRSQNGMLLAGALLLALLGYGGWDFFRDHSAQTALTARVFDSAGVKLKVSIARDLTAAQPFALSSEAAKFDKRWVVADDGKKAGGAEAAAAQPCERGKPCELSLTIKDPDRLPAYAGTVSTALGATPLGQVGAKAVLRWAADAAVRVRLRVALRGDLAGPYSVSGQANDWLLELRDRKVLGQHSDAVMKQLNENAALSALSAKSLEKVVGKASSRPLLALFIGLLLLGSLLVLRLAPGFKANPGKRAGLLLGTVAVSTAVVWGLFSAGGVSLVAAVICNVVCLSLLSLYAIDTEDTTRFGDHFRFLLMIFIYSGFWVLYFQMFDSVLWYVQAYVDASGLNDFVTGILSAMGTGIQWRFDVEHVTVINAGTIIALQLVVSNIVKKTKALPTMMVGIAMGTLGMGILAVNTNIWILIAGITMFSVGEMTAHPKFISYVGQTAPKARVAMYMGYLFLYGVIGSSIGGVTGANLYVKFVDEMNQPRTLWLIFTCIGVATIVSLLLYNKFVVKEAPAEDEPEPESDSDSDEKSD